MNNINSCYAELLIKYWYKAQSGCVSIKLEYWCIVPILNFSLQERGFCIIITLSNINIFYTLELQTVYAINKFERTWCAKYVPTISIKAYCENCPLHIYQQSSLDVFIKCVRAKMAFMQSNWIFSIFIRNGGALSDFEIFTSQYQTHPLSAAVWPITWQPGTGFL